MAMQRTHQDFSQEHPFPFCEGKPVDGVEIMEGGEKSVQAKSSSSKSSKSSSKSSKHSKHSKHSSKKKAAQGKGHKEEKDKKRPRNEDFIAGVNADAPVQ